MTSESRFQLAISVLLLILFGVQIFYYYPQLPNTMASKFGAGGQPISTMSKDIFFLIYGGTLLLMFFVFGVMGLLIGKIPLSLVNIPNKDYWFSEERKEKSCAVMQVMLLRYNNATILLLVVLLQFIIDIHFAKISPAQFETKFFILLGAYLLYTTIWMVQLYVKFKKPKAEL